MRLVMPVGAVSCEQRLVRVVRAAAGGYRREELDAVAVVPLIGAQGWPEGRAAR
jgi:protein-L-isoaspartate O-methyltransferase